MLKNRFGSTQVIRHGVSVAIKHRRLGKEWFMQTRQTSSPALKTVAAQGSRDHFQEVLAEAAALAHRYLRTIGERRVGVTQEAIDRLPALGGTLPAQGQDARELNRVPVKLSPAKSAFRDDSHIPDVGGRLLFHNLVISDCAAIRIRLPSSLRHRKVLVLS